MAILLGCWLAWIGLNVSLLLLAPLIAGHRLGAFTNGARIVIPPQVAAVLSSDELQAVIAHEEGHQAHRHALKNLARLCCFIPRTRTAFERQELQADDHAAARGHGQALASALRRLSIDPFDRFRASRLD